jgi:hypothetical protein
MLSVENKPFMLCVIMLSVMAPLLNGQSVTSKNVRYCDCTCLGSFFLATTIMIVFISFVPHKEPRREAYP